MRKRSRQCDEMNRDNKRDTLGGTNSDAAQAKEKKKRVTDEDSDAGVS